MSGKRQILFAFLVGLAVLALSGLPAWFHLSEGGHDHCASGCNDRDDHRNGRDGHDSENCIQCQLLRSHENVEPTQPVELTDWAFCDESPLFQDRGVTPAARHHAFPPCRAPPVSV